MTIRSAMLTFLSLSLCLALCSCSTPKPQVVAAPQVIALAPPPVLYQAKPVPAPPPVLTARALGQWTAALIRWGAEMAGDRADMERWVEKTLEDTRVGKND